MPGALLAHDGHKDRVDPIDRRRENPDIGFERRQIVRESTAVARRGR